MNNAKIISRDLGGLLIIVGIASLVVVIVPIIFGEWGAIRWILLTAGIFGGLGWLMRLGCRDAGETGLRHAMATAALGWLLVALIGVIPFMFIPKEPMDFLSAFFESMSGWTGTGLTMVVHENELSHTIQFWRSFIQWIGGVGVIVLTLAILARPGTGSYTLYHSEARKERIRPSAISTVRTIWWIFLLYTGIGIALFWITGMPLWEAINHCMVALATGGFSVTDNSMMGYDWYIQIAIIPMMILGAIAFAAHYDLLNGRIKKFFSDVQTQALLILLVIGAIILSFINLGDYPSLLSSFKYSSFQFISALTCTGFYTSDISMWQPSAKLILSFAMILGGAAGSTVGGIKLFRGILLAKGAGWKVRKAFMPPRGIFSHRLGGKSLSKEEAVEEVNEAAIVSFLWAILLFIGIIVLSIFSSSSMENVIFEVCSAQGNVGLSTGITGVNMPWIAKTMLILNMWMGRLEIIPILVMVRAIFRRKTF